MVFLLNHPSTLPTISTPPSPPFGQVGVPGTAGCAPLQRNPNIPARLLRRNNPCVISRGPFMRSLADVVTGAVVIRLA